MPVKSPNDITDSTLSYVVKANGSPIADHYPVISILTNNEINRIPYAEIVLKDGSVEAEDFPISESPDFIPGNDIEIAVGYDGTTATIFKGIIVKHSLRIDSLANMNLVITAKHKAVTMTFNKKEAIFSKKKDSDIISALTGAGNLSATVTATTPVHEQIYQKMATDWDFMLSRTDFCGFITTFNLDNLTIGKPKMDGDAVLRVAFGDSMMSFHAELNAEKQAPALQTSAWDVATLAVITSDAAEPTLNAHGNLSAKSLSQKLSQTTAYMSSGAPMTAEELKSWADAHLLRMRLNALKGSVTFTGNSGVNPGDIIELAGVGDRFNGNAFVSAVKHELEDGFWQTTVRFGLDDKPISQQPGFSFAPAAGQLPAIHGLHIGTVKKLSSDPDSQFRIQVSLNGNPAFQDGIWARLSNFYATANAGSTFLPEIGDEVVVGFMESNPAAPVILGSLFSSARSAPYTASDENNYTKAITTKSQLKVTFDDEKKIMKFLTPGANTITLNDDAKSIEIVDQNGNSVKMTAAGIELKSGKDITLNATGNITLNATGKLSLSAKQDATMEGMNVTQTAKVGFTAKGSATAEISASGQTTVKGGIVMIN
jgi:Rhs element Vgr protein